MKAYHFLKADMRSGEGNEAAWEIGETRRIEGPIKLCERGYHASPTLRAALEYAPGPIACLVEVEEVGERDETKLVAALRTLVRAVNVDRELRLFAADCAERVLPVFEQKYPNDERPRKAIEAARRFANGEISAAELAAARDAAWAAARSAAGDAARSAAGDAAGDAAGSGAGSVAWAAARDAAWSAAWDAAWSAAWDAAGSAAWYAAGDAAGDAEREWQRQRFDELVTARLEPQERER